MKEKDAIPGWVKKLCFAISQREKSKKAAKRTHEFSGYKSGGPSVAEVFAAPAAHPMEAAKWGIDTNPYK
ncbi:MAG: hypothetical protein WCL27_02375 [Betaproteobacteria bacterium]